MGTRNGKRHHKDSFNGVDADQDTYLSISNAGPGTGMPSGANVASDPASLNLVDAQHDDAGREVTVPVGEAPWSHKPNDATMRGPASAPAAVAEIVASTDSGNADVVSEAAAPEEDTAIVGAAETGTVGSSSDGFSRAIALQWARNEGQWYLDNTGTTAKFDLNVADVWLDYTGEGVTVAVYDNGVQATHPDLDDNYGTNLPGNDGAPEDRDNHGTAVAGIIAAENNAVGTVGVAFDATIVGVDLWNEAIPEIPGPPRTPGAAKVDRGDTVLSRESFDVVNQSFNWGYFTGWAHADNADARDVHQNLDTAVIEGRSGLGTIIVTAAGNHRAEKTFDTAGNWIATKDLNWDTNASNLLNDRQSIVVAAVEADGNVRFNSNPGANLLVSAFGTNIQTTDRTGQTASDPTVAAGYQPGNYTDFNDTSAAAPQVSGIVALMLEANPNLGWRDVQTILAYSARHVGADIGVQPSYDSSPSVGQFAKYSWNYNHADNWNGGGLHFSNDYGFGLVDARAAVRLAESWTSQSTSANELVFSDSRRLTETDAIPETGTLRYELNIDRRLNVETIEVDLHITHPRMSDLVIRLTSPEGTTSTLLNRPGLNQPDVAFDADDTWTLTSNAFRGEMSRGQWVLEIQDVNASGATGSIRTATLNTYGSENSADDTYIYTDEFVETALDDAFERGDFSRQHLSDTDGGIDTINAAAVSSNVSLDLNPDALNWIKSRAFFQIEPGTEIENAFGGDGNDDIIGNDLGNLLRGNRGSDTLVGKGEFDVLEGGAGNDVLAGGAAPDILDGGDGLDFASYFDSATGVIANLGEDTGDWRTRPTGDAAGDIYGSIEGLIGSEHGDFLTGNAGANELVGLGGADQLDGGAGADTMRGGDGDDSYFVDDAGHIDPWFGVHVPGDVVDEQADQGWDTVYARSATYTLADNVEGLEYITFGGLDFHGVGNALDNAITSMEGHDILEGGDGHDTLQSYSTLLGAVQSGNDTLIGGDGNDWLLAGDGTDTFVFGDGWDHDTVADFSVGEDVLDMREVGGLTSFSQLTIAADENGNAKVTYGDNSITLNGVNTVTAASFRFAATTVTGSDGFDIVYADPSTATRGFRFSVAGSGVEAVVGNTGNDMLDGSGTADYQTMLFGGDGDDVLIPDSGGSYTLQGGAGNDTAIFAGNRADYTIVTNPDDWYGWTTVTDNASGAVSWLQTVERLQFADGTIDVPEVPQLAMGTATGDAMTAGVGGATLHGLGGNDQLTGGIGNDLIDGGIGVDELRGGAGNDTLFADSTDAIIDGGEGYDSVYADDSQGAAGALHFRMAGSNVEFVYGGLGKDVIDATGVTTNVELAGQWGDDVLTGGAGDDSLLGDESLLGGGNDVLDGGAGNDWLVGGNGDDTFVFRPGSGIDTVSDFGQAGDHDVIRIEGGPHTSFDELAAAGAMTQSGADVVIALDAATQVTLLNVTLGNLHAGDFLFA